MDVSFQLYSARDFTPWDELYAILASKGYNQVEGFGPCYEDLALTRKLLDKNALTMPSGHFFPIGTFQNDFMKTIASAKELGMQRLFCPAPEDMFREGTDAAAWIGLAKQLNEVCKKVEDAGFRFGWHNHHWEFMPLPGGEIAMDLLLEHAPTMEWEMDVAWIIRGGADPLEWIKRYGSRVTTAHVKDIAPEGQCADEDGWADVGEGVMDWPAYMKALKDVDVDLFIMEHDAPSDVERFAQRSIENIRPLIEVPL